MQHYLSALQSYISNQVIQVAWQDIQKKLNEVETIQDIIEAHIEYVKSTLTKLDIIFRNEI